MKKARQRGDAGQVRTTAPRACLRTVPPRAAARHVASIALTAALLAAVVLAAALPSTSASTPATPSASLQLFPGASATEPTPVAAPGAESVPPGGEPAAADDIPRWLAKQREADAVTPRSPASTHADGEGEEASDGAALTPSVGHEASGAPATRDVSTGGQTALRGTWAGTPARLAEYLVAHNPSPAFSVPVETLAHYYVTYAAEVGLRADILWAQMIHETGFGAYGGSVKPSQNNYAGIGATGGGVPGHTFVTAELGVKAHIAHMVAYVFETDQAVWTNATIDPRYEAVRPRGGAKVLADLDGRWAVPGIGYGAAIERHVAAMNR